MVARKLEREERDSNNGEVHFVVVRYGGFEMEAREREENATTTLLFFLMLLLAAA